MGSGDGMDDRGAGVKHLVNIFRRLHRIFAHAWFQHKGVFWQIEGQTGLYVLFKTVCDNYELLPAENYKLPPEAEGLEPFSDAQPLHTILKPEFLPPPSNVETKAEDEESMAVNRTNTRRHIRSSPSTGQAVTTVLEADEEESDVTQKLGDMHIVDEETDPDEGKLGILEEGDRHIIQVDTEAIPNTTLERDSQTQAQAKPEIHDETEVEAKADVPTPTVERDDPIGEALMKEHAAAPHVPEDKTVEPILVIIDNSEFTSEKEDSNPEPPSATA